MTAEPESEPTASLLTLNGGSSSIRFALYRTNRGIQRGLWGRVERIGLPGTRLEFHDPASDRNASEEVDAPDFETAARNLIDWLEDRVGFDTIGAVGHRVVHGMRHAAPARVTPQLLDELRRICPYDPDHLPGGIALMEIVREQHPRVPQFACFDTAFHHSMPRVAHVLPIPRRFEPLGVRRYGFHGLSCTFLVQELARIAGPDAARGRLILAHLGNGASLTAVRDGKSVDTSMGFTPASGLPMGTRAGDLDPGVAWYLMLTEGRTPSQFSHIINHESGLLGVSATSSDMRDLLAREGTDVRAAEAIDLFCYQARKWIGAFAVVLGGLDTLVFSGGIGENAAEVRRRICSGLDLLGVTLDEMRNAANEPVISRAASAVTVRVIRTDEEQMIAKATLRALKDELDQDADPGDWGATRP
jgi:acetate kinase